MPLVDLYLWRSTAPKTRLFPIKTRVISVLGIYVYVIYIYIYYHLTEFFIEELLSYLHFFIITIRFFMWSYLNPTSSNSQQKWWAFLWRKPSSRSLHGGFRRDATWRSDIIPNTLPKISLPKNSPSFQSCSLSLFLSIRYIYPGEKPTFITGKKHLSSLKLQG